MIYIKYKKLKNGLRIVCEEIEYVKSVSLGVWINVGSRMEYDYKSGISHFIEHMMFKGTTNRSSRKISNDIDYYGGSLNAFTTHDDTCYHVKMPYNRIDKGIEVLSDMIINSKFDEISIEKEKSIIVEEIKMYEDSSEDFLYESLLKYTYSNKGIGKSVLGSEESVKSITREDVKRYFSKYYVPNNSVIVASGNIKFEKLVELVETYFSDWHPSELVFPLKREGQEFNQCLFLKDRDDEQVNIGILMPSPDDSVLKDFCGVKLLGSILGNTSSSRLFQHIREDRGLCYNIYTNDSFYKDYGEFGMYASCSKENLVEVLNLMGDEINDIKKNYISDEELLFAKEQYKGGLIMNIEDTEDRMLLIGEYEVEDKRLDSIENIIRCVDSIDLDYMKNLIDIIFSNKISVGITGKGVSKLINKNRDVLKKIGGDFFGEKN